MRPSWKTAQRSLARVWSRRDCQLPCLAAPPVTWGESVVLLSKLVPSPVNWSRKESSLSAAAVIYSHC